MPWSSLTTRLEAIARKRPSRAALVDEHLELTYSELLSRARDVAKGLLLEGLQPGDRVALYGTGSCGYMVGLLGTLMARGVWVPVDRKDPVDRTAAFLAAINPTTELDEHEMTRFASTGSLPIPPAIPASFDDEQTAPVALIRTSGTSGDQKAAVITEIGLATLCDAVRYQLGIGPGDRFLVTARPTFSAFLEEALATLASGSTIIFGDPHRLQLDPQHLVRSMARAHATTTELITPVWEEALRQLGTSGWNDATSLRLVVVGGERASDASIARASGLSHQIAHVYGTAETTATACYYGPTDPALWSQPSGRGLSLGRPLGGVKLLVDRQPLDRVESPATGELTVEGPVVANGYFDPKPATADRFDNLTLQPQKWTYRTGDIVERDRQGNLYFLGRVDRQAKVSGERVEPRSIEVLLEERLAIERALVLTSQSEYLSSSELSIHLLSRNQHEQATLEMEARTLISAHYPPSVAKSDVLIYDHLPLTMEGKVDRSALVSASRAAARPRAKLGAAPPARWLEGEPAEPSETSLSAFLSTVGAYSPDMGPDGSVGESFTSLGLMRLASALSDHFACECQFEWLVDAPPFSQLLQRLEVSCSRPTTPSAPARAPRQFDLTPAQVGVWLLGQLHPGHDLTAELMLLALPVGATRESVESALNRILLRHPALRTIVHWSEDRPVQTVTNNRLVLSQHRLAASDTRSELQLIRAWSSDLGAQHSVDNNDAAPWPLSAAILLYDQGPPRLALRVDHTQFDGWSLRLLKDELLTLLGGHQLTSQPTPYSAYQSWLDGHLHSEGGQAAIADLNHRLLSNLPPQTGKSMLGSAARLAAGVLAQPPRAYSTQLTIKAEIYRAMKQSTTSGPSMGIIVMTAWASAVGEVLNREQITLDVVLANRGQPGFRNCIGLLANVLPVALPAQGYTALHQKCTRVAGHLSTIRTHASIPREVLSDELKNCSADSLYSYEEDFHPTQSGVTVYEDEITASFVDLAPEFSPHPLALTAIDRGTSLDVLIVWTDAFDGDETLIHEAWRALQSTLATL